MTTDEILAAILAELQKLNAKQDVFLEPTQKEDAEATAAALKVA